MAKPGSRKHPKTGRARERSLVMGLDEMANFEEFKESILPALQKAIASKTVTAKQLAETFDKHAVARLITILATDADSSRAITAAKELLDRAHGKAAQKQETTHKFQSLKEEQLDALIKSRLSGTDALNEESDEDTH